MGHVKNSSNLLLTFMRGTVIGKDSKACTPRISWSREGWSGHSARSSEILSFKFANGLKRHASSTGHASCNIIQWSCNEILIPIPSIKDHKPDICWSSLHFRQVSKAFHAPKKALAYETKLFSHSHLLGVELLHLIYTAHVCWKRAGNFWS